VLKEATALKRCVRIQNAIVLLVIPFLPCSYG
jgi:hypothetical protein